MRYIVSGGTGYIGSHFVTSLVRKDVEVTCISRDRRASKPGVEFVQLAADGAVPEEALPGEFNGIVHLAASGGANTPFSEIPAVIQSNIALGSQLLELAARQSTQVPFVGVGTYWQRSTKAGWTHPNSFYAATKSALEDIAAYYAAEHQVPALFLQLSDVYGPNDSRNKLLSTLAKTTASKMPMPMTKGEQVCSFVHVSDVVAGITWALDNAKPGPPLSYSIRGPETGPLRDQLTQLTTDLNIDLPLIWGKKPYRGHEVLAPDFLDYPPSWYPKVGLAEGFLELMKENE